MSVPGGRPDLQTTKADIGYAMRIPVLELTFRLIVAFVWSTIIAKNSKGEFGNMGYSQRCPPRQSMHGGPYDRR